MDLEELLKEAVPPPAAQRCVQPGGVWHGWGWLTTARLGGEGSREKWW